jgi:hypothetical protein
MSRLLLPLTGSFVLAASAAASQVRIPVDTNTSTMEVTLLLQGAQDSDTSPLGGFLVVALDDNRAPTQIALRNFDVQATEPLVLRLDYGILVGRIDATARDLRIYHAQPGPTNPFVPIDAGQFTFTDVPFYSSGTAEYRGSGLTICALLAAAGIPCSSNIDLATLGDNTISNLSGTVTVQNGQIHILLDFIFDTPLSDTDPNLGRMSGHAVIRGSAPLSQSIVPAGDDWRYLDNRSDLGTAWRQPSFPDGDWAFGPAELGFGDGDEVTVINGGPATNRFITTYFRRTFNVADAFDVESLQLRVLRDDGVVVYLNGVEIYRNNMPTGEITAATLALTAANGAAESTYYVSPPFDPRPSGLLVTGPNVLAVEVHQASSGSSDLSFDLEMIANEVFSNTPPTVVIVSPTEGAALPAASLVIEATAVDPDGTIALVELFVDGGKVADDPTEPYVLPWPNLCAGVHVFTARATDNTGQTSLSAPVTAIIVGQTGLLLPRGSVWKYLDNGTDQGTAWQAPMFSDGGWSSGQAPLGYGDAHIRTTVGFGGVSTNKYITTYFRRAFTVADPAQILTLTARLLRDDGAIVYLNGTEVLRSNMPAGPVDYRTLAPAAVGEPDETNYFPSAVPANLLVAGTNVLAVEIHQNSITSSDLGFDLEIEAAFGNLAPSVALTQPANGAEVRPGAPILLQASATDPDGIVSQIEYFDGTNKVGEATAAPWSYTWTNAPGGRRTVTARVTDQCGASAVSAPVLVNAGAFSMVATGSVWKYHDMGANLGSTWRAVGFDDSAWPAGPAQLGYGDGDEATVVSYGGVDTNKHITTYFRRSWLVPDRTLISGLTVRVLRDDGAVVYLNAVEVFRSNMPTGAVTYVTLASSAVGGADESTYYSTNVTAAALLNGTNTLAVEVHQSDPGSSDLSFDLELVATARPSTPVLAASLAGNQQVLRWPSTAVGYRLYRTTSLSPPVSWQLVTTAPTDNGTWRSVSLPNGPGSRFYRLQAE